MWRFLGICVWGICVGVASSLQAQCISQRIALVEGWNPVYLSIQPNPAELNETLSGVPILMVHYWTGRAGASFVDNAFAGDDWLSWYPPASGIPNTLHGWLGDRCYLIYASAATELVLKGSPLIPQKNWFAGAHNLAGFQVVPDPTPEQSAKLRFSTFFSAQDAINCTASGGAERVYRLYSLLSDTVAFTNSTGSVIDVQRLKAADLSTRLNTTSIASGTAYWIRAQQASDYTGPLGVSPTGVGLDFGTERDVMTVTLQNRFADYATEADKQARTQVVSLTLKPSEPDSAGFTPPAAPLLVFEGSGTNAAWRAWAHGSAHTRTYTLLPGESQTLLLAVDRSLMLDSPEGAPFAHLMTIESSHGQLMTMGISARNGGDAGGALWPNGLWSGTMMITEVDHITPSGEAVAQPVKTPLNMRLLLHLAPDSVSVIQRVTVGVETQPSGDVVQHLAVDPQNLPAGCSAFTTLSTVAMSASVPRVMASEPPDGSGRLQNLSFAWQVPADAPDNPFYHKTHPAHDGLTPDYSAEAAPNSETYSLGFGLDLRWKGTGDAQGAAASLWSPENTLKGEFTLKVTNLRNAPDLPVTARGSFTIQRVVGSATLL